MALETCQPIVDVINGTFNVPVYIVYLAALMSQYFLFQLLQLFIVLAVFLVFISTSMYNIQSNLP
jgi:hypothetical protein